MKPSLKLALCVLSAAFSSTPLLLAQDSSQPATPPAAPAAPAAPSDTTAPAAPAPGDDAAPKKHHGGSGKMLATLTEKLSLTDEQKPKVGAILKDQMAQAKTIHDDTTLSDDDKHAKMADLMKSTHAQIRALLTPDQQATFDAMPPMGEHKKKAENN